MNWNLFGMNPTVQEFNEKHPGKTMIGFLWSMHWRFIVFLLAIYVILFAVIVLAAILFRSL